MRVKSAGVNPIDTYIRSGLHEVKPVLPYTPGHDGSGVVEEIGEQVTKFKVIFLFYSVYIKHFGLQHMNSSLITTREFKSYLSKLVVGLPD